jgi:hypothetical protein
MPYQQTLAKGQKQQLLAQALAGQAMTPKQHQQGRIVADTGMADGLGTLAAALAARRMGKKADATLGQADLEKQKMQAAALQGFNTPPNMVQMPQTQNPYARAQTGLEAGLDPNVVSEYMRAQRPDTTGGDPADIAGYKLAKQEGYGGTFSDYLKEFKGREANVSSNIQNAKFFENLTPEQRARYVEANRTVPVETINQVPTIVRPGGDLQPLSTLPKEASAVQTINDAKAEGTETGQARGTAVANLPVIQSSTRAALETVDKMLRHPGMETATGLSGTLDPRNYIPGTEARNFQVLRNQAQGQVFLDAYQSLKGGGVITEIEGLKAEQAKARMDSAQSDEEFREALNDYANALRRGLQLAEQRAGSTGGASGEWGAAPPAQAMPTGGAVKWGDL